ncbi:MAG: 2-dehydropantoate 2-reductase [Boseongicola sp.]|nr:2-dehydropantoate 2-reductase [Boseongicola sp.]MDE0346862.1 2-dehydropantoate 2-reductase [Boseongicola sp.]MXW86005.1 2-dehydropantoate 2-reductase [Boseongicola sp. SB0667_bin_21]MYI67504.1 2-dehydropantoate 2-reductase [Boseongicola sp. SB0673_bin_14]
MKIAIYGTGAMGSLYAGQFCEAGHEVWAVDPWIAHVDAINVSGLRLDGVSGNRRIEGIRAVPDFAEVGACDLIVIATKMAGVGPAACAISQHRTPGTMILTIQNGLGAAERIGEFMPVDNVFLGVADGFGASLKGPGHAHHNAMNLIRIGEIEGGKSDRAEVLAEHWRGAGFNARAYDDIQRPIWEKFLCNVTYSAACTVFDMTVGELQAHPERWAIALGAMQEANAIARAKKIKLAIDDPVEYVTAFGARMPNARPSMLLDHEAGRRSELDAINGQVPELGRALGIPTPYNDTLVAVLRQREAAFDGRNP